MAKPSFTTLIDLLEGARDVHPSRGVRIVSPRFQESYYSYADLYRRILFHADHLRKQGVEAGQHVVVPMTTQIDVICSFLAMIWIGAVPVSIGGQMSGQDKTAYLQRVRDLIDRYHFDRLLVDQALRRAIGEDIAIDPRLVLDPYPLAFDTDLAPPKIAPEKATPDSVVFVQFSSGSTSNPKGVQITHGNIASNLHALIDNDGRTEKSTTVSWLPLYHDMGLVGCFFSPWTYHHPLVLMHPVCFLMKPVSLLDYFSRYRGTVSAVPNFCLDMCTQRIRDRQLEARQPDLGSIEYIYNGSEPVSAEAIERFYERFEQYGIRRGVIQPAYGMAEATLMVTASEPGSEIVTRSIDGMSVVSSGRPQADSQVRIADEDGRELPPDMAGEILIRGSCVTPGYYQSEETNKERFRDGWLHTGDLGLVDREGKLFVTGRLKDLIIVNGRNFYAHDIASKVEELPFVKTGKTHVFSLELGGREEVVVMTVLESRMSAAVKAKLQAFKYFISNPPGSWLTSRLGAQTESFIFDLNPEEFHELKEETKRYLMREFGLPIHDVFLVQRIPKTTSGKVRRGECEDLYMEYVKQQTKEEG